MNIFPPSSLAQFEQLVLLEVEHPEEPLWAPPAPERPLSRVRPAVLHQVGLGAVGLVAAGVGAPEQLRLRRSPPTSSSSRRRRRRRRRAQGVQLGLGSNRSTGLIVLRLSGFIPWSACDSFLAPLLAYVAF